jgi:peroxiredoxin
MLNTKGLKMKVHLIISILLIIATITPAQIELEFETTDNEQMSLGELSAKGPVLINFWATWCQPCKAEIKHLKTIYDKYQDIGLTIVGINQDSPKSLAKVNAFIASQKINYPIVLDPNNQIFQKFNGQVMPYSLLIDGNQEIVFKHTGYLPGDEKKLEEEIKKLLGL